jgi:hypothetical protein
LPILPCKLNPFVPILFFMPEQPAPRRPSAWTLSKAAEAGQLVRIRCQHCNIRRYYEPGDLHRLLGDIPANAIRMKCERCGLREYVAASFVHLSAAERQATSVRRLAEIRMVRRVVWRDE